MVEIEIPNSFLEERTYAVHVLMNVYLAIPYKLIPANAQKDWVIKLENDKILTIRDDFFSSIDPGLSYLKKENLPKPPASYSGEYSQRMHSIYGTPTVQKTEFGIETGVDVFAGAFFALTRWEDCVIEAKDQHNRTVESETYQMKHGLQHEPIVNQYVDFIWKSLVVLGYSGERKKSTYEVLVTHDVDYIARYDSPMKLIRALAGDIVLRRNPFRLFTTLKEYIQVNFGSQLDNYNTHSWLMDISEKYGLTSRFYFIPSKRDEPDARYDIEDERIRTSISEIQSRGHVAGLHGSYTSYNDPEQFARESTRLKRAGADVTEGRQHYLRFENPTTWNNWNNTGLKRDSTIGYHSDIGFKAGTCLPYPVFDVIERKMLALVEFPLIVMEGPLIRKYGTIEKAIEAVKPVIDQCKKYNGQFVFLWHPENFNHPFWGKYRKLYTMILDYATAED